MSISSLLILSSIIYLILKIIFLPQIISKNSNQTLPNSIAKKAVTAGLSTATTLASLVAISAALALGLAKYMQGTGRSTLVEAEKSIAVVRFLHEKIGAVSGHLALFVLAACAFAMIFWSYRRTKVYNQNKYNDAIAEKMESLQQTYLAGELEELPPSEAMIEVDQHIQHRITKLKFLKEHSKDSELEAKQVSEITHLEEIRHSLDLLRRAEMHVMEHVEKQDGDPDKKRGWRLATFFSSEGFFDTLGFTGKVLAVLGMLAIVPASLVVTGPELISVAEAREAVLKEDIRNFEFLVELEETEEEFEGFAESESTNIDLSTQDEEIADELALIFESTLVINHINGDHLRTGNRQLGRAALRETVRGKILSRTVARSGLVNLSSAATGEVPEKVITTKKILAESQGRKPATSIGKKAATDYRNIARSKPELWAGVKGKYRAYKASFGKAASPIRVSGIALNHAIGDALSSTVGNRSLFAAEVTKFGANVTADTAEAYYKGTSKKFIVEFNRTGDFSKSARGVGNIANLAFSSEQVAGLRQMVETLPSNVSVSDNIRSTRQSLGNIEKGVDQSRLQKAVARMNTKSVGQLEALSGFGDYFPGHTGQEFETSKAKTARALNLREAPPSLSTATKAQMARSKRIASRSSSFARLKGSSRIGGVLIGQEPQYGEKISVDDFLWEIKNGKLWFDIAVNNKPAHRLGPYSPAIANLAMAYAADGRPTTVTMVTAKPLNELKILTHPALVDTGLGCRARRLDQFADGADNHNKTLKETRLRETSLAMGEVALYNYARNISILEIYRSQEVKELIDAVKWNAFVMNAGAAVEAKNANSQPQMERRLKALDTELRITKKPAYFNKTTANFVKACIASGSVENFQNCVIEKASKLVVDLDVEEVLDIFAPEVRFETWSGVREKNYTVDDGFAFMDQGYPTDLGPLRFMVQLAISSPAYFADKEKKWYDDDNVAIEEYADPDPWEFPETAKILNPTLLRIIKSELEMADVYSDMVEFVVLQRFFRVALDGSFSDSFPLDELLNLQEATESFVNTTAPTLRWNAFRMQYERLLYSELDKIKNPKEPVKQCMRHIEQLDASQSVADIKALGHWDKMCGPAQLEGAVASETEILVAGVSDFVELRNALNIPENEFLALEYLKAGCPKP